MKHSNTLFLFAIAASFFFQGCKKIEVTVTKKTDQFSFSQHALEYVHLTLGKYLIYKDSASAQLDSVVVTTSNLENLYVPSFGGNSVNLWLDSHPAYYHDFFHLILSKYSGNQSSNWFIGNGDAYHDGGGFFSYYGTPGDTLAVELSNQNGFTVFHSFYSEYSNLSMNIEGKTYSNIIVTYSGTYLLNPSDPGYQVYVTYWAKPVGIIKRIMIDAGSRKTYTLLRNN